MLLGTILFPQPRHLLALSGRQPGPAVGAVGPCTLHPLAHGRLRQVHVAGHGADALAVVEHQVDHAGFEVVSELPPGRRFGVSAIGLDIVSPTGKMSTEIGSRTA
jgi:hypothetical protein